MVRMNVLNDALRNMTNAEKRGKRQVMIRPSSKVVIKFLSVMMKHGTTLLCAQHQPECDEHGVRCRLH
jgi:ribosomal protein S8